MKPKPIRAEANSGNAAGMGTGETSNRKLSMRSTAPDNSPGPPPANINRIGVADVTVTVFVPLKSDDASSSRDSSIGLLSPSKAVIIASTLTPLKLRKSSDTEDTGSKNSILNFGARYRLNSVWLSGDRENDRLPVGAFGSGAANMSVGPGVENSLAAEEKLLKLVPGRKSSGSI